jgi:hypothetical protein
VGPSNVDLPGLLTKYSDGKKYVTDDDAKQAVTSWLQTFDTDFLTVEIQAFVP